MSNKQIDCLLNWLEFSLIEKHYLHLSTDPANNNDLSTARCFMLNALIDVFYRLVKSNHANWRLPVTAPTNPTTDDDNLLVLALSPTTQSPTDFTQNLKRLAQFTSLLLNNLSAVRLRSSAPIRPAASLSQTLQKLSQIKGYLEPYTLTLDTPTPAETCLLNQTAADLALVSCFYHKLAFLNRLIDHFKKTYEKYMNLYFLKQHYYFNNHNSHQASSTGQVNKITNDYLNATVTTLNILNNIVRDVQSPPTADLTLNLAKYSFNASRQFSAKRYLGHLISRNVLHTCLQLIDKLSDYLLFYSAFTRTLNRDQLGKFLSLVEPALRLCNTLLKNLVRSDKFTDTTPLNILFRFNDAFNYCIVASLAHTSTGLLEQQASLVHAHLVEICIIYTTNPKGRIKGVSLKQQWI